MTDKDKSIRERLQAPVPNDQANTGGDSRGSDVTENGFQNTDSRADLAARGRDESQTATATGPGAPYELRHAELDAAGERSAERKVAALFMLSVLGTFGFIAVFFFSPFKYGEDNQEYF